MSNVNKMRKLYLTFPILQTLSAKLSWSHYVELLKINDPQERSFYMHECEQNNWGRKRTETSDEQYALSASGSQQK